MFIIARFTVQIGSAKLTIIKVALIAPTTVGNVSEADAFSIE
jgi:hypothetical protein